LRVLTLRPIFFHFCSCAAYMPRILARPPPKQSRLLPLVRLVEVSVPLHDLLSECPGISFPVSSSVGPIRGGQVCRNHPIPPCSDSMNPIPMPFKKRPGSLFVFQRNRERLVSLNR